MRHLFKDIAVLVFVGVCCWWLFVHCHQLFDVVAAVAQTGNLVLSAELAFALEPVVEQVFACRNYFERLQGDVLVALCFVV